MVEAGHWLVLPYSTVQHATDLQISPPGVVPQRDCWARPAVDYTLKHGGLSGWQSVQSGNQPHSRSQHNSLLQLPGSICPQCAHRKIVLSLNC